MRNLQSREAKGLSTIAATHWLTRTQEPSLSGSFQWHYTSSAYIPGTVPSPNLLYLSTSISFKITIRIHQLSEIPRNLSPWKPEFPWSLAFSQVFRLNELPGGGEEKTTHVLGLTLCIGQSPLPRASLFLIVSVTLQGPVMVAGNGRKPGVLDAWAHFFKEEKEVSEMTITHSTLRV